MPHQDFRAMSSEAQEATRRKAVEAVRAGITQVEAARVFGVTRQAIASWMDIYQSQGTKGLRAKKRGRPPGGRLQGWQAAQVVHSILDRCPDQLSTKSGLCRDRDYAELRWRIPFMKANEVIGTTHNHRASRKARRRSGVLNRRGLGEGSATRRRAASFIVRSASI
jgi:transposase